MATYASFLGTWTLIPESCQYDQGDPPRAASYVIEEASAGTLRLSSQWRDASGETHEVTLEGPADGRRVPFAGGELADAVALDCVSERELNSYAYRGGVELMVAQRQLDQTGNAMRVVQLVRLPDGERPVNISVYRRSAH